ncbi:MAG: SPOR domain-containing protein [bacterium]|nr:SPOR domain-containing protein [bacterium]
MTTESAEKKPTVRRRRRATRGGKGGMPRIMWLAILVCVAGAVALFRSGGSGPMPTGLGENRTVVTAPEGGGEPVSGDVEIAEQGLQLTPEEPVAGGDLGGADNAPLEITVPRPLAGTEAGAAAGRPASGTAVPREGASAAAETPAGERDAVEPVAAAPATESTTARAAESRVETEEASKPEPTGALPPRVVPQPRGPYLVQVGSFGDTGNAQKEADRLRKYNWDASVRVGNKAGGGLVYRVQIGYFATREDAQAFIDQNRVRLPDAIPAHR